MVDNLFKKGIFKCNLKLKKRKKEKTDSSFSDYFFQTKPFKLVVDLINFRNRIAYVNVLKIQVPKGIPFEC